MYRKAAEQGYYEAQYKLGECYEYGKGVIEDIDQAMEWYGKANENEDLKDAGEVVSALFRCLKNSNRFPGKRVLMLEFVQVVQQGDMSNVS